MTDKAPFPLLKNATILQIMEEVNVPLTEAELTEPGRCRERVREVFSQLLQLCWGLTPETLAALPSRIAEKQSQLAHPSIYDDALPEAKFFCLLSDLLRRCGYREFGFRDLAAPQARRFRKQLSALINFLKYREDMGHLEATVMDERELLFAALDEVTENHQTVARHLEEAKAVHHEKMLERQEAEAEMKDMELEAKQHNETNAALRKEKNELEKLMKELKDEIDNLAISLRELQAEERKLGMEVVDSPDRIKVDLARANELLERAKRDIEKAKKEGEAVRQQQMTTVNAEGSVRQILVALDKMEKRLRAYESVAEECEGVKDKLEAAERDLEARRGEKQVRQRSLDKALKETTNTVKALTSARENAKGELAEATRQMGVVESERLEGLARIEASQQRAEELKARIEEEKKRAEEEVAGRIASFHKFEAAFRTKEAALNAQIGYLG